MTRFGLRGFALATFVLVLVLLGGVSRSAASSASYCNQPLPSGRLFCATIEDLDNVSPSGPVGVAPRQINVTAYQYYKLTVSNVGGSTLTNGTATFVLTDNVPNAAPVNSTAVFVSSGSASFCSLTSQSPNTVSCNLGNLAAGSDLPTFYVAYRTSTTPNVVSTDATVTVGFKEASNGTNGANPATKTFVETTSLEPFPEVSTTWAPPGQDVSLGTTPGFDSQFSTLGFRVPPGHAAFVASESEGAGTLCAAGLTCFGEVVTTDLSGADTGTFSSTNLFHLRITMALDLLPGGNVNKVVVVHQPDTGPPETISARCSSSPPASTDTLPCILVSKDNQAKLLFIDVWGARNGGWHPGI